jgi:hypothetical protein
MGLKGYRLWVMGQLDSTCRAPTRYGRKLASYTRTRRTYGCARDVQRRGQERHGDPFVGALQAPPAVHVKPPRAVALQVAFERQTLKPVFQLQLIGYRLWV